VTSIRRNEELFFIKRRTTVVLPFWGSLLQVDFLVWGLFRYSLIAISCLNFKEEVDCLDYQWLLEKVPHGVKNLDLQALLILLSELQHFTGHGKTASANSVQ